MSQATYHWEMVVTRQQGNISVVMRGPETKASPAPVPHEADIFGIVFKLGTFMPHLPLPHLVDAPALLPLACFKSFWLHGATWELPDFDNADTFVQRLERENMLLHDPLVSAALQGQIKDVSLRSVQRRFVHATGLSQGSIYQIDRARHARTLLQQGISILDTVEQAGYADQPHLTRSLKRFMGQTPAQILRSIQR